MPNGSFWQRDVAAFSRLPRLQVGKDISAAEGVDRLFRVANHEESGIAVILGDTVDRIENPVLHRIGILELIDHRQRKLLPDGSSQALTARAVERGIQPGQQVIEAHLCPALLLPLEATTDPAAGVE